MLRHLNGRNWILLYLGALSGVVLSMPWAAVFITVTGLIVIVAEATGFNRPPEDIPFGWSVLERGPCGHPVKFQKENTNFTPLLVEVEPGVHKAACRRCSYVSDFAMSYSPPQHISLADARTDVDLTARVATTVADTIEAIAGAPVPEI